MWKSVRAVAGLIAKSRFRRSPSFLIIYSAKQAFCIVDSAIPM